MAPEHRPRKRFGQHFLQDPAVIRRILAAVDPGPGDPVVEIGPGQGVLTRSLLEACGSLDVVELDRDLAGALDRWPEGRSGRLRVHQADALRFDFAGLARSAGPLRVVGNLPYNISTPLLFHLLESLGSIRDIHAMLQHEVVERLAARAGRRHYGRLSVMIQYHCRVERLFGVPPDAFRPVPKVDSAVVRLIPHADPPARVPDYGRFQECVRRAFAQRRKTLRNNLKGFLDPESISAAGVDPGARAETLDVLQFAALARAAGKR